MQIKMDWLRQILPNRHGLAKAYISPVVVDFGSLHVGDKVSRTVIVTNTATGNQDDILMATLKLKNNSSFSTSNVTQELAPGEQGVFSIELDNLWQGDLTETGKFSLLSHSFGFPDIGATSNLDKGPDQTDITIKAMAYAFAIPRFHQRDEPPYYPAEKNIVLDLGNISEDKLLKPIKFKIMNDAPASAFSDMLSGSFSVSGEGFPVYGLQDFENLLGGNSLPKDIIVNIDTSAPGPHTETVTLKSIGRNDSGYKGELEPVTLTIKDNIVPAQQSFKLNP